MNEATPSVRLSPAELELSPAAVDAIAKQIQEAENMAAKRKAAVADKAADEPKKAVATPAAEELEQARLKEMKRVAIARFGTGTHRIPVEIMTRGEAAASRKEGLRNRKCALYDGECMLLWNYTRASIWDNKALLDRGDIFTVGEIVKRLSASYNAYTLILLDEEELAKAPPQRVGNISNILTRSVLELMRIAPNNQVLRAQLRSLFLEPPPKEADTYEKLKDWIEFNFRQVKNVNIALENVEPRRDQVIQRIANQREARDVTFDLAGPAPTTIAQDTNTFRFRAACEENEYGNCSYSVRRTYDVETIFYEPDLVTIAGESQNFVDFLNKVSVFFEEEAGDLEEQNERTGEYNYSDHERSGCEDRSFQLSRTAAIAELRRFIQTSTNLNETIKQRLQ